MTIMESEKVYLLHTNDLFLAPIAFKAGFLCDTHLRQFSKVLNLREDVMNDELKYHIAAIWQYRLNLQFMIIALGALS